MDLTEIREVPLSQGFVALVDAADLERVMAAGRWHAVVRDHTTYARRMFRVNGRGRNLYLHQFLTGWSYVDHHNGNGLDNRQANLREATHAENAQNRRRPVTNTSGFKGVSWSKKDRRWRAQIGVSGKYWFLGNHVTPEAAAHAYDRAALEHYGEFAALNFPTDLEEV